jgi:hypothetical protein
MASWYGTDLFLEKFPAKRARLSGYFSYADNKREKCVFFSADSVPKVMVTVSFDSTYNPRTAIVDSTERAFTPGENDIYSIRKIAVQEVLSDTLFKRYKNTDLNFVPFINGDSKKVFILTGPQKSNVVIFGNDYLLVFDAQNKLVSKKQLHRNIIPIEYTNDGKVDGNEVVSAVHTHLPETGDLITSTDICTLMLYESFAKWKSHVVMGEKTMSIWDCQANTLAVITKDVYDKIYKDQKKRHKDD